MRLERYEASQHLTSLRSLMNWHLTEIIPGWELSSAYIDARLHSNPEQYVLDPWVIHRSTVCAVDQGSVVAAVHMLRYGSGPEVSNHYRNLGEIAWAMHTPTHHAEAVGLLREAQRLFLAWGVREHLASFDLAGVIDGVPDRWPHVAAALSEAGFQRVVHEEGRDAIRYGPLPTLEPAAVPPDPSLQASSNVGPADGRFAVLDGRKEIGYCQFRSDVTRSGVLPALAQWGQIDDFWVAEPWRGRGIGSWLLSHACAALAKAGRNTVVLCTSDDAEGRRAGHLYDRFGWPVVAYMDKVWAPTGH